MDLVAAFVHDTEASLVQGKEVTLVTIDAQGAFDAVLKRRLLKRMTEQGWPLSPIAISNMTTPSSPAPAGTTGAPNIWSSV
jgi:hypothetical protein